MSSTHRPPNPTLLPAGAWPSTLAAADLAAGAVRRAEPRHLDGIVYWAEGRPAEGGRTAIVAHDLATGTTADLGPPDANIRTLVHEYGGAAWIPTARGVVGARFDDQRLCAVNTDSVEPLTVEPPTPRAVRFADPVRLDDDTTVWARETHDGDEVANDLVSVSFDGEVRPIATGRDFYAAPTVSPDGSRVAFIAWDHPNMPWDHTTLWTVERRGDTWTEPVLVVDGPALQQPRFGPDGTLHVVSDATGFWNIHRVDAATGTTRPIVEAELEFGVPSWAFGNRTYDWAPDGSLWCSVIEAGVARLCRIVDGELRDVPCGFTDFGRIEALPDGRLLALAASWIAPMAVVVVDPDGSASQLSAADPLPIAEDDISVPELIEFSGHEDRPTHAFYFPPASSEFALPEGESPPLLVMSHGGPTGNARSSLDLGIQYWTNRGVAVVDVNYGGSTGFGTPYRNRLRENWGVTDVVDCAAAARHLADSGRVDAARLSIKGGSAGGFTTLCTLVFHDGFSAGISRYGVADLETLATDTHKFESRYLDSLVGPYPDAIDTYRARSPIHHMAQLSTPMIVLQGSEDPVVPPSQAEQVVDALAAAGVPHAYLLFAGESHGFRQAQNISAALEAELSFLGQVLGFEPAGEIERVALR